MIFHAHAHAHARPTRPFPQGRVAGPFSVCVISQSPWGGHALAFAAALAADAASAMKRWCIQWNCGVSKELLRQRYRDGLDPPAVPWTYRAAVSLGYTASKERALGLTTHIHTVNTYMCTVYTVPPCGLSLPRPLKAGSVFFGIREVVYQGF